MVRRLSLIAPLLVICAASASAAAAPGDLTTLYGAPDPLTGNSPLHAPRGVSEARDGSILVADTENHRVLRVTREGVATTIAGILNQPGFSGDGGPATQATLRYPRGVAALADGSFLIADSDNYRVRRVSPAGVITTVAGGGDVSDGPDPRRVRLGWPESVVAAPGGGFLIVESTVGQIRRVLPDGTITRVAGAGLDEDSEGIPATAARFSSPTDASFTRDGGILVTDSVNNRIRLVAPNGTITTVAGIGYQGTGVTGDGGPATAAQIGRPHAVAATSDGGYLIAQELDHRIRQVSPSGTITTPSGGPGGGSLSYPHDLILLSRGGGVVANTGQDAVSLLETDLRPASPKAITGSPRCTAGPAGLAITGWTRPRFRSLLRGAWTVFVQAPAAGRISTRLAARGRTLARRSTIVRPAERKTVRLRPVRRSRAVVRGRRALKARVTVRFRSKTSTGVVKCAVRFRR